MIGSRIDVITCLPILFSSAGGAREAAVPLKRGRTGAKHPLKVTVCFV